ncbi:MAG: hypothetical protein R3C59_19135 [Planctomycetaceae bacterium]
MTEWVLAPLDPAAVRRDPNETQLFKDNQAGEDEYAGTDALVREILQNSMDAGTDEGPVRVRLALHQPKEMPGRERLKDYFSRLQTPLQKREVDFDKDGVPTLSEASWLWKTSAHVASAAIRCSAKNLNRGLKIVRTSSGSGVTSG